LLPLTLQSFNLALYTFCSDQNRDNSCIRFRWSIWQMRQVCTLKNNCFRWILSKCFF